jgi:hypothetical protein
LAQHFVEHDFLVPDEASPETDPRMTAASILVTSGTTPNVVVERCMTWIAEDGLARPFFLTWFTTGALVPATLRRFRNQKPELRNATQLFLFPGQVDREVEAVSGPEAEEFAARLQRSFTYSLLSAYAFDPSTGNFCFHFSFEVRLQRACALHYADHKIIFLDSSKFRREGEIAYSLKDLVETASSVTFYSSSICSAEFLRQSFESLFDATLSPGAPSSETSRKKTLRLILVGRGELPSRSIRRTGVLAT